jgi:hypothetical protein
MISVTVCYQRKDGRSTKRKATHSLTMEMRLSMVAGLSGLLGWIDR